MVKMISVPMTTHTSNAVTCTQPHQKGAEGKQKDARTNTHAGITAFIHKDLWDTLQDKNPPNEVAGRALELRYGDPGKGFTDLIVYQVSGDKQLGAVERKLSMDLAHWVHTKLAQHNGTPTTLMGDFNAAKLTHHRSPPHLTKYDRASHTLHKNAKVANLRCPSTDHGYEVLFTYTPNEKEVSVLDYIYETACSVGLLCATARNMRPFSRSHRALLFSYPTDPLELTNTRPPEQVTETPNPHTKTSNQKWPLWSHKYHKHDKECPTGKCAVCHFRWTALQETDRLSAVTSAAANFQEPPSTDPPPTDQPEHERSLAREAANDLLEEVTAALVQAAQDTAEEFRATRKQQTKREKKHALSHERKLSLTHTILGKIPHIREVIERLLEVPQDKDAQTAITQELATTSEKAKKCGVLPQPPELLNAEAPTEEDLTKWLQWTETVTPEYEALLIINGFTLTPEKLWRPLPKKDEITPPTAQEQQQSLSQKNQDDPLDGLRDVTGEWITKTPDLHDLIKKKTEKMYDVAWFTKLSQKILWSQHERNSLTRFKMNAQSETSERLTTTIKDLTALRNTIRESIMELEKLKGTRDPESSSLIDAAEKVLLPVPFHVHAHIANIDNNDNKKRTIQWLKDRYEEAHHIRKVLMEYIKPAWHHLQPTEPSEDLITEILWMFETITTDEDVFNMFNALKRSKVSGPSGLCTEHIIHASKEYREALVPVINELIKGNFPNKATLGTLVPTSKDLDRFRPIHLLEVIYRGVDHRITSRLLEIMKKHQIQPQNQFGSVRGGSAASALDNAPHGNRRCPLPRRISLGQPPRLLRSFRLPERPNHRYNPFPRRLPGTIHNVGPTSKAFLTQSNHYRRRNKHGNFQGHRRQPGILNATCNLDHRHDSHPFLRRSDGWERICPKNKSKPRGTRTHPTRQLCR